MIEFSSSHQIREKFQRFFPYERDPSFRFRTEEVATGTARFLLVTAFPYRGPALFSVYAYEQVKPDVWRLRAVIPIIKGSMTVSFNVDGPAMNVVHDGVVIVRINSTSP
jgi:hypothetical protein